METSERHTLTLRTDDRSRAHARVLALIEAAGLDVADVRLIPARTGRPLATWTIAVEGAGADVAGALARIGGLPGVIDVVADRPALATG